MKKPIALVFVLFALVLGFSIPAMQNSLITNGSLTSTENNVLALVNGTEAYSYDKHLENIAFSHYAFRAAGSSGANETADWIAEQFRSFGLDTEKEAFQFTNWDLLTKPTLSIDEDGNPSTTSDQTSVESFQCLHYSWPGTVFADLTVLPLPSAASPQQLGATPIGSLWNSIDTTGKIVLVGREIRSANSWQNTFSAKLRMQPPSAVIFTWWYDWMSFVPDFFSSAGGRPTSLYGHYFWELNLPAGFVGYNDGLLIRNKENAVNISAKVNVNATVDSGPHYNVVGTLQGYDEPDKYIVMMGHYDTVMTGGFCDNGAGTCGVLELAHVFTEAIKRGLYYPKYSIRFISLASEEIGLVGSINYVAKHKDEMNDIIAVINLDCIGSDNFAVTRTEPYNGLDLDQLVIGAANDLGITTLLEEPGASDETAFLYPLEGDNILMYWWDTILGVGDAHPVGSSILLISFPLLYQEYWTLGQAGWIHTSYDNSTSTGSLNWVTVENLETHIKIAALTVVRLAPSSSFDADLNKDGAVNIMDIAIVARAYGTQPGDGRWNEKADLDNNGIINIVDVSIVAKDFGKTI